MSSSLHANSRWENMWKAGLSKGQAFDTGIVSPILKKFIDEDKIPKGRCLVPGCGRAYDVAALASCPERHVIGVDLSETAVKSAMEWLQENNLHETPNIEVKCGNFFELDTTTPESKFNFIYDYTFLCALDPEIRPDWARQMSQLLLPGGELFTLIFPITVKYGGPPFAVSLDIYKELLEPVGFECLQLELLPPEYCHEGRQGMSGLGRWKRK